MVKYCVFAENKFDSPTFRRKIATGAKSALAMTCFLTQLRIPDQMVGDYYLDIVFSNGLSRTFQQKAGDQSPLLLHRHPERTAGVQRRQGFSGKLTGSV